MKNVICIILLGLIGQCSTYSQSTVDATGGFVKNSRFSASYALGEIQTITLKSGLAATYATSGVIQPDPLVITLTEDLKGRFLKIYPNPVADVLKIEYDESTSLYYKIYNLHGWILAEGLLVNRELQVGMLSPGVYMIQFTGKILNRPQVYLVTKI